MVKLFTLIIFFPCSFLEPFPLGSIAAAFNQWKQFQLLCLAFSTAKMMLFRLHFTVRLFLPVLWFTDRWEKKKAHIARCKGEYSVT